MVKPLATEEVVFAAADALAAEGVEPSLKMVQERTGGSYTTVKRHLQTWMDKRKNDIACVQLPAEIEARGREFAQALYGHALREAKAALDEPLQQAQAARDKADNARAGAEAEVARLEVIEQEHSTRIETLIQRVRELEMNNAALHATVQEKTAALDRLDAQLAQTKIALAASEQEVAVLRATNKTSETLQVQLDALQRIAQGLATNTTTKPNPAP